MSEPTNASPDGVRSGELDLDGIEARAQAATPGPFRIGSDFVGKRYVETNSGDLIAGSVSWEDAPHIAGMDPETTLALVAEVRRLRPWFDGKLYGQLLELAHDWRQEAGQIDEVEGLGAVALTMREAAQQVEDLTTGVS